MSAFAPWSLRQVVGELDRGERDIADVFAEMNARIDEVETDVRAWVIAPGEIGGTAAPERGTLGGVPLAVKDIIDVAGLPTRCGSALRAEAPAADQDAAIVTAWRAAGATPVGKSVTTEFAYFAPGPTRNPAGIDHTPGGSSSGSAAAVASGMVPLALGSQTAASVTRPAAFCGVASLVMSRGAYPTDGVFGLAESFDAHGVFAATVDDLSLAWSALTATREGHPPSSASVAVWRPEAAEPVMTARLDECVASLQGQSITCTGLGGWHPESLVAVHRTIMSVEAHRERVEARTAESGVSAPLRALLDDGGRVSESALGSARDALEAARTSVETIFRTADAILAPAALGPAPRGHAVTGDPVLSRPWQALGLPVVTIPCGTDDNQLPLALQLVGRAGAEADLLALGRRIESALAATPMPVTAD